MTIDEWKEMTSEERQTYIELVNIIEKENRSLLRSYRYWSNKYDEKEEENEE